MRAPVQLAGGHRLASLWIQPGARDPQVAATIASGIVQQAEVTESAYLATRLAYVLTRIGPWQPSSRGGAALLRSEPGSAV